MRLPRETARQYEAFELYRNMGSRRGIRQVAEELGVTRQYLERVSVNWNWSKRCRLFDEEQEAIRIKAFHERRKASIDAQAELGAAMRSKALSGLSFLDETELEAGEVARLAEVGVKIERLAYGDSTDNKATAVGVQFVLGEVPPWAASQVKAANDTQAQLEEKERERLVRPRSLSAAVIESMEGR